VDVRQAADNGPAGTLVGIVTGGLVGLIAGPAGAAFGAYVGGFGGLMYDLFNAGVGLDYIDEVSASLTPGKTALVADVDETWVTPVDTRLGDLGATMFRRYTGDVIDDQLTRDTEAASKELDELDAEVRQSTGETRAKIEAAIERQRRKLQELEARIEKTAQQEKAQFEARLHTLQAQMRETREERRDRIEGRMAELNAAHEVRRAKLDEARKLAKQSVEKTREALVG
jgi:uncharacterized membrane protein